MVPRYSDKNQNVNTEVNFGVLLNQLNDATTTLLLQSGVLSASGKKTWETSIKNLVNDISIYAKQQNKSVREICLEVLNSENYTKEQKQAATFVISAISDLSPYLENGAFKKGNESDVGSYAWFVKNSFGSDYVNYANLATDMRLQQSSNDKVSKQNPFIKGEINTKVTGVTPKDDDPFGHGHTYTGSVPPLTLTETPFYTNAVIFIPSGLINASLLPNSQIFSPIMNDALKEIGGSLDFENGTINLPKYITGEQYKNYLNKLSGLRSWAESSKAYIEGGLNNPADFETFVSYLTNGKFDLIPSLLNSSTNGVVLLRALGTDFKSVSVSISPTELSNLAKFSVEGRVYMDMTLFNTDNFKGDLFVYFSNTATWMITDKKLINQSRFGAKGMIEMHDLELSPNTSLNADITGGFEVGINKDTAPQYSTNLGADATLFYKSVFASIGASAVGLWGEQGRLYKQGYVRLGWQPSNRLTLSIGANSMDFKIPSYELDAHYKLSPNISVGLQGRYENSFKVTGSIGISF